MFSQSERKPVNKIDHQVSLLLQECIKMAQEAVAYDSLNQVYSALFFYKSAITAIDLILMSYDSHKLNAITILPNQEVVRLKESRGEYIARSSILIASNPSDSFVYLHGYWDPGYKWKHKGSLKVQQSPDSLEQVFLMNIPQEFISTPSAPSLQSRYFHIAKNLIRSINEGGYITESLYCPRIVWLQDGSKLSNIDLKQHSFEILIVYLSRLERFSVELEIEAISEYLVQVENALETVKTNLQRKLKAEMKQIKEQSSSPPRIAQPTSQAYKMF